MANKVNGQSPASPPQQQPSRFKAGDKVLCFEPDKNKAQVLYDSKVLDVLKRKDATTGLFAYEYKIHFSGWKTTWDRVVKESEVLTITDETRALQKERLNEQIINDNLKKKKKKATLKEKLRAIQANAAADKKRKHKHKHKHRDKTSKRSGKSDKAIKAGGVLQEDVKPSEEIVVEVKDDEDEEEEKWEFSEQLVIPDKIKKVLEYDHHGICKRNKLVVLPVDVTVLDLLLTYIRHIGKEECREYIEKIYKIKERVEEEKKKQISKHGRVFASTSKNVTTRSANELANEELVKAMQRINFTKKVVEDVRIMFDFLLPQILLYKTEISQFKDFLSGKFTSKYKKQFEEMRKAAEAAPLQKENLAPAHKKNSHKKRPPPPEDSDSEDEVIVQNVIKINMPPPPPPPPRKIITCVGRLSRKQQLQQLYRRRGRDKRSRSSSRRRSYVAPPTGIIPPTQPIPMIPLDKIKKEPVDDVPSEQRASKRRKVSEDNAVKTESQNKEQQSLEKVDHRKKSKENVESQVNDPVLPVAGPSASTTGSTDSEEPVASTSKNCSPVANTSSEKVADILQTPLLPNGNPLGCELLGECDFPWACQHLNKFMDELNSFELLPKSELKSNPSAHPSACYGYQHLIRLFVKMPEVLSKTSIPMSKMRNIVAEMNIILQYFNGLTYLVTPEHWYISEVAAKEKSKKKSRSHSKKKGGKHRHGRKKKKKSKKEASAAKKAKREAKAAAKAAEYLQAAAENSEETPCKPKLPDRHSKKKHHSVKHPPPSVVVNRRGKRLAPTRSSKQLYTKTETEPISESTIATNSAVDLENNDQGSQGETIRTRIRKTQRLIHYALGNVKLGDLASKSSKSSNHVELTSSIVGASLGVRKSLTLEDLSTEQLVAPNISSPSPPPTSSPNEFKIPTGTYSLRNRK